MQARLNEYAVLILLDALAWSVERVINKMAEIDNHPEILKKLRLKTYVVQHRLSKPVLHNVNFVQQNRHKKTKGNDWIKGLKAIKAY